MWFDQSKITALEQSLKSGRKDELDVILKDILAVGKDPNVPTFCPRCGKDLVTKPMSYLRMMVKTCPDGHGVWLSPDNARKIKLFFVQHLPTGGGTKDRVNALRVLIFLVSVGLAIFNFSIISKHSGYKNQSGNRAKRIGAEFWPTRDFRSWNPLPVKTSVIDYQDELAYFRNWILLMNEGIINRLNMQDALNIKRPVREYAAVYNYYAARQNNFIARLRNLTPPERLGAFHALIVDAAVHQVAFYDDYARQKTENPSLELSQLQQQPHLKECDKKLWAAYHEFQRIYPNVDAATNNAIEQRLCWLDVV